MQESSKKQNKYLIFSFLYSFTLCSSCVFLYRQQSNTTELQKERKRQVLLIYFFALLYFMISGQDYVHASWNPELVTTRTSNIGAKHAVNFQGRFVYSD